MRTYAQADRKGWHFLLGNGTREFRGWPICLSSYGWVSRGNNKDRTYGWADSDIEIGPFRFAWQIAWGRNNPFHVTFSFEIRKNDN